MKNILTQRELSVVNYLTQGLTNEEISNKLNISVHTVKAHLESAYEKLEVSNRVQAAIKVVALGLIDLNSVV